MGQFESMGPFLIPIVGTVFGTIAMVVLAYPFVRVLAKRMEQRGQLPMQTDVTARLARIEAAVEAIAIEVERISESQRFLAKHQSDNPLPPGNAPPNRLR